MSQKSLSSGQLGAHHFDIRVRLFSHLIKNVGKYITSASQLASEQRSSTAKKRLKLMRHFI